jgi:hypothetical protein
MTPAEAFKCALYFSYSQFMVFDKTTEFPACAWTQDHSDQGFARRASTVCFGTLSESGTATVAAYLSSPPPRLNDYERVIMVPLLLPSGTVAVGGPDEYPFERTFHIPAGQYRLTAAQRRCGNEEGEEVTLFFERTAESIVRSEILIADPGIKRKTNLLESAAVPRG